MIYVTQNVIWYIIHYTVIKKGPPLEEPREDKILFQEISE